MQRVAIVMAGGSGERFWPLSRKAKPKQLLRLTDSNRTMLAEAVQRAEPLFGRDHVVVATSTALQAAIQAEDLPIPAHNVLAEPAKRNTAGALVWATASLVAQHGQDLSLAVLTSDQAIRPAEAFRSTVQAALETAEATGELGTIGIVPNRPATGYGYIELGEDPVGAHGARRVLRFLEKPSEDNAVRMVDSGRFLWNSGMFFWTARAFHRALEAASPEHAEALDRIANALTQGDTDLAEREFGALPDISIDYALMERARSVFVLPAQFDWDDLGAWDALGRKGAVDDSDNVVMGDVLAQDVSDSIVWCETGQKVCVVGVEGHVLVVTDDAILLMPKHRSQDVRKVLNAIKESSPDLT